MTAPAPSFEIDARGFHCPVPTLKLRKAMAENPDRTDFLLTADDPMARIDIPHFCNENGITLTDIREAGTAWIFTIHR